MVHKILLILIFGAIALPTFAGDCRRNIYGQDGEYLGFTRDGNIYSENGEFRGFIRDNHVFDSAGNYRAFISNGWIYPQ
jgi:hypothetical protein